MILTKKNDGLESGNILTQQEMPPIGGFREEVKNERLSSGLNFMTNVVGATNISYKA